MCRPCTKSYVRRSDSGSIMDVAVWAAKRARRALFARLKRGNKEQALIVDGIRPANLADLVKGPSQAFMAGSFVEFGPIARDRIGMQAQCASRYVGGAHGNPDLGAGLRFKGRRDDYHFLEIHADDVEEFVRRVLEHRRKTGQIA